jgi:hypothetical protein
MSDTAFYDDEFMKLYDQMHMLFPNLPFCSRCDDYKRLDNILLENSNAIIYFPLKCYCCCPDREGAEVIHIKRNINITYRDFYQECNDKWQSKFCNHNFLENIYVTNNIQINLEFGN